jgi:hypothetical protein
MSWTETYELRFRETPKSLNEGGVGSRRHWSVGYREKKHWEELYLTELMVHRVRKPMIHASVAATIHWRKSTNRRRDEPNYEPAISKPLADALRKGGYIADDTKEFFDMAPLVFEVPEVWGLRDPRIKGELVIDLLATYKEDE